MVALDANEIALLLVPSGYVVVNKTLGTNEAEGIRFSVLPSRAYSRVAVVQFGRTFLQAYPDHSMPGKYNAFYSAHQCT